MSNLLEITLYVTILVISLPFIVRYLGKEDKFFTFRQSNAIKFVNKGVDNDGNGNFLYMIPTIPGFILDKGKLRARRSTDPPEKQTFWEKRVGARYYGFWPFNSIHQFEIEKQYENLSGTGPENWVRSGGKFSVRALRYTFPRPYVFTDIELADRWTISLKLVVKFEVVDPYIPVYVFRGDFFTQAGSILEGAVIDELLKYNIGDFIGKPKGEVAGLLSCLKDPEDSSDFVDPMDPNKGIKGELNRELIKQVGLRLVGISINDYQPGDEKIVEAIRLKSLAIEQGDAAITTAEKSRTAELINADKDAQAVVIRAKGQQEAQNLLTKARGNRIRETVATLASSLGSPDVVAQSAANILEMEAAAGPESKITFLSQRGGDKPSVTIPVKEDNK